MTEKQKDPIGGYAMKLWFLAYNMKHCRIHLMLEICIILFLSQSVDAGVRTVIF